MIFTFGVSTYNQSDMILETLESIKYQVINYGSEISNRLYIIDDCSTDHTVDICKKWICANKSYFEIAECIAKPENKGTVDSYNLLMDLVEGDYFVSLAGDDLISSDNFYKKNFVITQRQIDSYICMTLINGKIGVSKARLASFYLNSKKKKSARYNLRQVRMEDYFHSPSTIITKTLYQNAECKNLNQQFRLFEDDPTWYSIVKNISDVEVNFVRDVVVLYRMHEKSISNRSKGNNPFDQELQKLRNIYIEDARGLEKTHLRWRYDPEKRWHNSLEKSMRTNLRKVFYVLLLLSKDFRSFLASCEEAVLREQAYYDLILQRAEEFSATFL